MADAQVVFIAVGTPPRDDGSADLTYIEAVARDIALNLKRLYRHRGEIHRPRRNRRAGGTHHHAIQPEKNPV